MQASAGARKYAGAPFLRAMMDAAATEFPDVPIVFTKTMERLPPCVSDPYSWDLPR